MTSTYLFVPGNRPDRFAKALTSGAGRVILDLEDAVSPADKPAARVAIATFLVAADDAQRKRIVVRLNDVLSDAHDADLQWLANVPVHTVMLSKCESAEQVAQVLAPMATGSSVIALIETVRGVLGVHAIARATGVSRLAFGSIDYMLDLDLPGPGYALDYAATAIAMASRAADLPPPIAGVTADLDPVRVEADMQHARALGFGAKMCIHPSQVATVHAALKPSADEAAWAERVVLAWQTTDHTGTIRVDGQMVDKPVIRRAQRILAQALLTHLLI